MNLIIYEKYDFKLPIHNWLYCFYLSITNVQIHKNSHHEDILIGESYFYRKWNLRNSEYKVCMVMHDTLHINNENLTQVNVCAEKIISFLATANILF